MTNIELVARYAIFAVIAIVSNLATQRAVFSIIEGPYVIVAALILGTAVGLVIKYVLDKKWIFGDPSSGVAAHSRKFGLYTLMGVATTLIFWGTETAFWLIWQNEAMRELGAVLGLGVGYITKYQLDKRFVFESPDAAPKPT